MSKSLLICVCGAEFDNSQKFNSHKSHCKEHYLHKYGSLIEYEAHKTAKNKAVGKALHEKAEAEKQFKLDAWLAEQHKCERCGETMTTKFGSGRFCSRACANTRELSNETKAKIKVIESYLPKQLTLEEVKAYIVNKIETMKANGEDVPELSPKNYNRMILSELSGQADGKLVAQAVTELSKEMK